jgi:hypothetical protein
MSHGGADHEKAQYAWDHRRSRVVDCDAPLASVISKNVALSLDTADARIGRPLTATSVAGVHRRVYRRAYRRAVKGTTVAGLDGYGYYRYSSPAYSGYPAPSYYGYSAPSYYGYSAPYYGYSAPYYGYSAPSYYGSGGLFSGSLRLAFLISTGWRSLNGRA